MQVDSAIRALIAHGGRSARAVSLELGHAEAWARLTGAPGRDPRTGTLADVADVCGVDVALVDRETGETLGTIDPPRRARGEG